MAYEEARQTLLAEREKLVAQLDDLGATETGELKTGLGLSREFADAGAAAAERTGLLVLAESLTRQLSDVDAAIAGIDNGTYGTCASCGEEILAARLEARPASLLCVPCKSNA